MEKPTPSEVRLVIRTPLSDDEVAAFIDDAVLVLDQVPAIVSSVASLQRALVKWVTAHFISQGTGGITSESQGEASMNYASAEFGKGLSSSIYGQRALLLDSTGSLSKLGQTRASISVL